MKVEIFNAQTIPQVTPQALKEVEYLTALEALKERWLTLMELGLDGQAKLVEKEEFKVVTQLRMLRVNVTYPRLTEDQWFILGDFFRKSSPVSKYQEGLMPVQVLDEYIKAKNADIFTSIRVAYHQEDPLLLGWSGWREPFLMVRWGDALREWSWFVGEYLKQYLPLPAFLAIRTTRGRRYVSNDPFILVH